MTPPAESAWKVLIVEDDPAVAHLHGRVVADTGGFSIVGIRVDGEGALRAVAELDPDLMLLDLTLVGLNGLALLQRLRAQGHGVEVIAVTAARNPQVIRDVLQRGAVDYLVKPFTAQRLREALRLFEDRMAALSLDRLDQENVDVIWGTGRSTWRWLPKGLTPEGLAEVRAALSEAPEPLSADEIGSRTGTARVTARRYLEYLAANGQVIVTAAPSGPGRPRKLYQTTP